LAEATREFDREGTILRTKPLSAEMRAQWARVKKRGRPRIGKGSKRVLISMEADLLAQTDRLARRRGIGRSELIAEGLKSVLAKAS
jgi:hypothetical protein